MAYTFAQLIDVVHLTEVSNVGVRYGTVWVKGWTQSTGTSGAFPFSPPRGWKIIPGTPETRGAIGSHGGCSNCIMTELSIMSIEPASDLSKTDPGGELIVDDVFGGLAMDEKVTLIAKGLIVLTVVAAVAYGVYKLKDKL